MTGLLIIFVSFAFGIAGGFLAMHFYFQHHYFVTKEEVDEFGLFLKREFEVAESDTFNKFSSCVSSIDKICVCINELQYQIEQQAKTMNDHYRWSLGIWNDIANHRESIENPIPESIQDVAREEVQLNEDEEVMPMGPLEFQQSEIQVVKEGDPIDIKIPDRVKPLRQDKKKKGKKNADSNTSAKETKD